MSRVWFTSMVVTVSIVVGLFSFEGVGRAAIDGEASPASQLDAMRWLAGTWEGPMGKGVFRAYYSTPDGGKILSYSEMRRGEIVAFHEFERFEVRDGVVHLQPFPGGRPVASFKLSNLAATKATFENPENDFPSRIVYERIGTDRLVITLTASGSDQKQVYDLVNKNVPPKNGPATGPKKKN